jgi:hypothetical protein
MESWTDQCGSAITCQGLKEFGFAVPQELREQGGSVGSEGCSVELVKPKRRLGL